MTLERIDRSARQLSESDIDVFETKNGIRLPESYREFLLKHNGGAPKQDTFVLPSHRERKMDVKIFYGIDHPNEFLQLQWQYDFHHENLIDSAFSDLFPVGNDSFGDPIYLDLSSERYGAVIFFDMVPIWKEHTAKDLYVVADTFSAFLNMLYEYEDED